MVKARPQTLDTCFYKLLTTTSGNKDTGHRLHSKIKSPWIFKSNIKHTKVNALLNQLSVSIYKWNECRL